MQKKCLKCGKQLQDSEYFVCNSCAKEECTLQTAIEIGKEYTEEIEINGFIATYFKDNICELEQIVLEAMLEIQMRNSNMIKECVEDYCECDTQFFKKWVGNKWKKQA